MKTLNEYIKEKFVANKYNGIEYEYDKFSDLADLLNSVKWKVVQNTNEGTTIETSRHIYDDIHKEIKKISTKTREPKPKRENYIDYYIVFLNNTRRGSKEKPIEIRFKHNNTMYFISRRQNNDHVIIKSIKDCSLSVRPTYTSNYGSNILFSDIIPFIEDFLNSKV